MTVNYMRTALLLGLLTGLILFCGHLLGGQNGMLIALFLAGAMNLTSYWFSDRIVLSMYRAQPVSPAEAPRLHAMVDRLTARSGLPKPKLYVLPQPAPNAFATGHMFIVKPLSGRSMLNLFSTHPPIRERIRRLLGTR